MYHNIRAFIAQVTDKRTGAVTDNRTEAPCNHWNKLIIVYNIG